MVCVLRLFIDRILKCCSVGIKNNDLLGIFGGQYLVQCSQGNGTPEMLPCPSVP